MTDIYRVQPELNIEDLKPGTTFAIEDRKLIWRGELGDGEAHIEDFATGRMLRERDPLTGIMQIAAISCIQDAIARGVFRIIRHADGSIPVAATARPELDRGEILAIDPYSEARETLLNELKAAAAQRSSPTLSQDVERIWAGKLSHFGGRPATSTVREWMTRTDPELPVLAELMSEAGRVPRARRLEPEVVEIVEKHGDRYWDTPGRNVRDAVAAGIAEWTSVNVDRVAQGLPPLKKPSPEAFRRRIREVETREHWVSKFGEVAARRHWNPSGHGTKARRALELVMIDDTVLDAVACIHGGKRRFPAGRPYLCVAIDVATRCVLGFRLSFRPPTTHTAAECMRRVGREKMEIGGSWAERYPVLRMIGGKPDAVLADNGKNYVSAAFHDAMGELGITLHHAPIHSPKAKAIVERFFRTLKTWLLAKLPGATLEPKAMRELGYDPEAGAVLLVEELEALIQEFLNTYHISLHSGINTQPAAAWLRSIETYGRQWLDPSKLDVMTGITIHGRRLTANGVRWMHETYRIGDLARLQKANLPAERMGSRLKDTTACTVKIKVDPDNVGRILVWDRQTRSYVELRSTNEEYAWGLSLDQHMQAREWASRRNMAFNTEDERIAAVAALNDFIESVIPDMSVRERRAAARTMQDPAPPCDEPNVPVLHADARHDGMGEVLDNDFAADGKLDAEVKPSRPAAGVVAEGRSHDADPREADEDGDDFPFDPATGLFVPPEDDDRRFEEDYS